MIWRMTEFIQDEKLWVELRGRAGRWHIHYNPHTHPGRFAVVNAGDEPIYVSKAEVAAASAEAAYWIDGYIRGSEPEASRMFGEEIWEADDDDPRWGQWTAALNDFRTTGMWNIAWDLGHIDD